MVVFEGVRDFVRVARVDLRELTLIDDQDIRENYATFDEIVDKGWIKFLNAINKARLLYFEVSFEIEAFKDVLWTTLAENIEEVLVCKYLDETVGAVSEDQFLFEERGTVHVNSE